MPDPQFSRSPAPPPPLPVGAPPPSGAFPDVLSGTLSGTGSGGAPYVGARAPAPASGRTAGRTSRRPRRPAARDLFLVDLDCFFVSVERRRDPSLAGRPVVVGGCPGERGVVACASYEARAHGVKAGMPIFQAQALCPADTVWLHGDHAAYAQASRDVFAILGRFSPLVEAVSLDEAFLDLTGCERHHRSWLAAGAAIREAVWTEAGLPVSVGIGGTRAVAKIAAGLSKPGGVLEVRRGEEAAFLSALPLEYLPGVGPRMRRELARFNLHTAGDLACIPGEVLEETFGRVGAALALRARGLDAPEDEPEIGQTRPKHRSISRETSFAQDTSDPRFIDGMTSYLAQRAASALRARRLVARAVGVRLRYADFQTVEIRRRLDRPTDRDAEILAIVQDLWRRRYDRRVNLRLVGVQLLDVEEAGETQLELPFSLPPAPPLAALPKTGAAATGGATPGNGVVSPAAKAASPRFPPVGLVRDRTSCSPVLPPLLSARLDETVDLLRDRYGFGSVVRGRSVGLLERLPRSTSGFRLRTPSCSH